VLTLFNDNGVFKPQQGLAQVDRSAAVTVTVSMRGARIESANEWTSNKALSVEGQSSDRITVNIPAGGIAVVELIASR
jgi:hypothetical protein